MALDQATLQARLDDIDLAIATGQLRLTMDGKTIEYRSIADLRLSRAHVAKLLEAASTSGTTTSSRGPRYRTAVFADG